MSDRSRKQAQGELKSIQKFQSQYSATDDIAVLEELTGNAWGDVLHVEITRQVAVQLALGGPEVRVLFTLNPDNQPVKTQIQHRDQYEPWYDLALTTDEQDAVNDWVERLGILESNYTGPR